MNFDTLEDVLIRCSFMVTGALTHLGATHDLSLTQLRVLGILRDRRCRMTELADYCGLDKSTMSSLIDRAARRGLVATEKNADDRRAVDVFLAPAGRELALQLTEQGHRILMPTTDRLDATQRADLHRLLEFLISPSSAATQRSTGDPQEHRKAAR
jgi:DNA-binding MarR family transcriptional regulator